MIQMPEEIRCILICLVMIGYIVTAFKFFNKRTREFQDQLLQDLPEEVIKELNWKENDSIGNRKGENMKLLFWILSLSAMIISILGLAGVYGKFDSFMFRIWVLTAINACIALLVSLYKK